MKRTILMAACRQDVLQTLPVTLRLAGARILVVKSGLDAIRRARSDRPDLVILDSMLPDMDGSTAADILRRLPSTIGIPTILLQPCSAPAADAEPPYNRTELLLQVAQVMALCRDLDADRQTDEQIEPLSLSVM